MSNVIGGGITPPYETQIKNNIVDEQHQKRIPSRPNGVTTTARVRDALSPALPVEHAKWCIEYTKPARVLAGSPAARKYDLQKP